MGLERNVEDWAALSGIRKATSEMRKMYKIMEAEKSTSHSKDKKKIDALNFLHTIWWKKGTTIVPKEGSRMVLLMFK